MNPEKYSLIVVVYGVGEFSKPLASVDMELYRVACWSPARSRDFGTAITSIRKK